MEETAKRDGNERRPWLSHYAGAVEPTCDYPAGNAAEQMAALAAKAPGEAAVRGAGAAGSWGRLLRDSRRFAAALRAHGIAKGERVALLLRGDGDPQALAAFYGSLLAEAVAVPLAADLPEAELRRRLAETGAAAIVLREPQARALPAWRDRTALRVVVAIGAGGLGARLRQARPAGAGSGSLRWSRFLRAGTPSRSPLGGRFGRFGRFALRRRDALLLAPAAAAPFAAPPTAIPSAPGHTGASALTVDASSPALAVTSPSPAVPAPSSAPAAAPDGLAVIRYTAGTTGTAKGVMLTHANLIASAEQRAAWRKLDEAQRRRYWAELPAALARGFGSAELRQGYGLAESTALALAQPVFGKRRRGALGIPLPDTDARVVGDESLEPLAPGEIGELALKGPQLAAGYWGRPAETAAALQNGWFRTGDLVRMEADGFFVWISRTLDRVRVAGQALYPREIELVLLAHPAVEHAAVAAESGGSLAASVRLKPGRLVSGQQLERWCRERLPPHQVPESFLRADGLPLSRPSLRQGSPSGDNS